MGKIKIVFFDFDGTLFNPETQQISEKTMQALKALRERGITLCLATGRSPSALPDFGDWEFDVYLTFNGALCYNKAETIFSNPVAPADVEKVIENAAAMARPVSLALKDRLVANGIDQDLADYYAVASLELAVAEDFDKARHEDVYQVMLGWKASEKDNAISNVPGVKIVTSWERAIDVIPRNGGKGRGIQKVLQHYGLTRDQALAFGDSHNDLEMLQTVGKGIAMGNAAPQLKEIAYDVCGSVYQDGIYYYCLEHGLI